MGLKKVFPSWLLYVARRFSRVDRTGHSSVTGSLSSIGIAFGVMTLIVVMAVMNGFQSGSINSILEISSYHVRASIKDSSKFTNSNLDPAKISDKLSENSLVSSVTPFVEAQSLITGTGGRESVGLLRFVPPNILKKDAMLSNQLQMISGNFLDNPGTVVLGYLLARSLGVKPGDTINMVAMSGDSTVDLFAQDRVVTVSGIFACNFDEINSSFAFLRLDDSSKFLGDSVQPLYGVKLYKPENASRYIAEMQKQMSDLSITFESWENYNRSFIGALRIEKNILMLLVFLIFIVVAVNIFNSMRRMVYERREEISVLSALGSTKDTIQRIFLLQGFRIGLAGALPGFLLGLFLSVRMDTVFELVASISYGVQYFFLMIVSPSKAAWLYANPMFQYYAQVPAQPRFGETAFITLFGIFSAVVASWFASRHILKLSVAEVLSDE